MHSFLDFLMIDNVVKLWKNNIHVSYKKFLFKISDHPHERLGFGGCPILQENVNKRFAPKK